VIAISTSWNATRHGGWADAVRELGRLGHRHVVLDGDALHGDAGAAGRAAKEVRGKVIALFAPSPHARAGAPGPALCSPRAEVARVAIQASLAAANAAARAGASRVIVRPGRLPALEGADRDAAWVERMQTEGSSDALCADVRQTVAADHADRERCLEALCRSLHVLLKKSPDTKWLLETPSSPLGLALPEEAELVFNEFRGRKLGYWHDSGHAARLAVLGMSQQDEWLGRLGHVTHGVTLSDWSPIAERMPPGSGLVQWRQLRFQVKEGMFRVLALDPEYPSPLIDDTLREVGNLGF